MVPSKLQSKNNINLDVVIDGLNTARGQTTERRATKVPLSDAMAELEEYKQWSKFSGCISGCTFTQLTLDRRSTIRVERSI